MSRLRVSAPAVGGPALQTSCPQRGQVARLLGCQQPCSFLNSRNTGTRRCTPVHADTRRYTRVPACSCGSCSRARGAGAGAGRPAAGATTVHSRSVRGNKVPGYVSMRPFITLAAFQACMLRSGGQGGREWLPPPAHAASPAAVNPCSRLAFLAGARRNTQKHGNTRVRVFLCPIHVACSRVPVLTRAPCRSLCSCVLLRAPAWQPFAHCVDLRVNCRFAWTSEKVHTHGRRQATMRQQIGALSHKPLPLTRVFRKQRSKHEQAGKGHM